MKTFLKHTIALTLVLICLPLCSQQDEATISDTTLITKAKAILNNFPNATTLNDTLSTLSTAQKPSPAQLQKLGITDTESSKMKLVRPYEQEAQTKTIETWLKNYSSNKSFYTDTENLKTLTELEKTLVSISKSKEAATTLQKKLEALFSK